jgi:hypothetical protein
MYIFFVFILETPLCACTQVCGAWAGFPAVKLVMCNRRRRIPYVHYGPIPAASTRKPAALQAARPGLPETSQHNEAYSSPVYARFLSREELPVGREELPVEQKQPPAACFGPKKRKMDKKAGDLRFW